MILTLHNKLIIKVFKACNHTSHIGRLNYGIKLVTHCYWCLTLLGKQYAYGNS